MAFEILTLEVTTGPNSARAISADRAIWMYDVVEQFSFPSLVTDPRKRGINTIIGELIHSYSCANFI